MASKTKSGKSGPGRAQRKGSSEGRATPKGSKGGVGRYTPPEAGGRYTPPAPRGARSSPRWYGIVILALLLIGVLMILLNYMTALPGAVSIWYLIAGIVAIAVGLVMATRYR
jgi:hypothetical protein